jgi:hypothetical protein
MFRKFGNVMGALPLTLGNVMAGLVPAIHVFSGFLTYKPWMPGT